MVLFIFLTPLGVLIAFLSNPGSIHEVRQADSLSFALNYLHFDFNFFHPQNFNLTSEDGKCASEFPIFYYFAAIIALIGIKTSLVLKLLHGLTFFGAIYFLWKKTTQYFNNNYFVSSTTVLILLTSTVLLYYSNNLLPDIAALGLTIAGISQFYFLKEESKSRLMRALFLMTLASMIKITYGIYPLAFLGTRLFISLKNKNEIISWIKQCLLFILPVASWWLFVKLYNEGAGNNYYFNTFLPIWESSSEQRKITLDHVLHYWRNSYYPEITQILFALSLLGLVFFTRQIHFIKKGFIWISLIGVICYVVLFFEKFRDHDYYFLVIVPFVYFTIIEFIHQVQNGFYFKYKNIILSFALLAIGISSYSYVYKKLPQRIAQPEFLITKPGPEYNRTLFAVSALKKIDPTHSLKILIVGDSTMNNTLVKFERKGWQFPIIPVSENDQIPLQTIAQSDVVFLTKDDCSTQEMFSEKLRLEYRESAPGLWLRK
ncbi:MAG: hypothetical protein R2809_07550 [Flavobacteriales bacterium]